MEIHPVRSAQIDSMLERGSWELFGDHNEAIVELVRSTLLQTIGELAGAECRRVIERDGLDRLHLHLPLEHYNALRRKATPRIRRAALDWTTRVVRNDLGVEGPFFLDHDILLRINLPLELCSRSPNEDDASMREKYRRGQVE